MSTAEKGVGLFLGGYSIVLGDNQKSYADYHHQCLTIITIIIMDNINIASIILL